MGTQVETPIRLRAYIQQHTEHRIEIDSAIMIGKPREARGPNVEVILRKRCEYASENELLENHPHIAGEDIGRQQWLTGRQAWPMRNWFCSQPWPLRVNPEA